MAHTTPTPTPRPWWRRPMGLTLLLFAGLLLVMLGIGAWLLFERPLTVERWAAVRSLEEAGLERHAVATSRGDLAVWSGGAGAPGEPAVVLLHGAGDHAGAWAEIADDLAAEHRLVIPDLPGHGESAPGEGVLPMGTLLDGVVTLLESDLVRSGEAPPPVLVGNSLGGWLSLLVGVERPELASRLVVVNGGGTPGPADPAVLVPSEREEAQDLFTLLGAPGPIPGPVLDDVVRRVQDGAMRRFMSADDHRDHVLTGRLDQVAVPVDLVWGDLDGFFPLAYAEATAAALPAARLTLVEGCGHVPPRYCPDSFARILAGVLAWPPPEPEPAADDEAEGDAPSPTPATPGTSP